MIPFCTTSLNTLSFKISWNRIHAKRKNLTKVFVTSIHQYVPLMKLSKRISKNKNRTISRWVGHKKNFSKVPLDAFALLFMPKKPA